MTRLRAPAAIRRRPACLVGTELLLMWMRSATGARRLGTAGALAVAAGGTVAGALPVREPWGLWATYGPAATTAGAVLAYTGLTLLVLAWWAYGRLLAGGRGPGVRYTLGTLGWWAAPLVLAPPLHSADVYSYIAQGAMVLEGHDVYAHGPSVLGPDSSGADAAASVGGHWTDTPAPYGPVFLLLAKAVVAGTGGTLVPAVLGMRLLAVAALVLVAWAVRGLAAECGAQQSRALWLAVLNPLLLLHVVGGMHNDGLMIGLMLTGVLLALRGRPLTGSAVVALAVMVKSPAVLALLFIGLIGVRRSEGPLARRLVKGLTGPALVAAAVVSAASLLGGTGFGWLRTQGVAGTIHTPLSLTSDLGQAAGLAARALTGAELTAVKGAVQTLGLAAALAVIAFLAFRTLYPWRGRRALDPVYGLGMSLVALVALSPMVQPWYLLWGTAAVAAAAPAALAGEGDRVARVLTVLSVGLVYETAPSGHTPPYGFVLGALACAVAVAASRRGFGGQARTGPDGRAGADGPGGPDGPDGPEGGGGPEPGGRADGGPASPAPAAPRAPGRPRASPSH
ncbi:polyprenol phosphomannose-dependent alpha 1,6 mannosyltransferase MptB [Streptomyces sp. PKU-MA01144]|uniref:polyprenol phosphomannose-dependent alpha 1,6 mannosyltransferase MptB n=1 Tax=Streptomyces sp. PKU-MA01144 TaxID=2729138 RepID=UPI00147A96CC|nr:polyprenol phosphomannose-dependent alpha 1,6 mannosyltransferase MptB [Streptomyces sp. PKU-MA01144]NNJ06742.1 polyprenol phosphomannose-dependent alpha 1,6 mannosyltransferase MptB [Streptomyces sp. PKU-MA01144]